MDMKRRKNKKTQKNKHHQIITESNAVTEFITWTATFPLILTLEKMLMKISECLLGFLVHRASAVVMFHIGMIQVVQPCYITNYSYVYINKWYSKIRADLYIKAVRISTNWYFGVFTL